MKSSLAKVSACSAFRSLVLSLMCDSVAVGFDFATVDPVVATRMLGY